MTDMRRAACCVALRCVGFAATSRLCCPQAEVDSDLPFDLADTLYNALLQLQVGDARCPGT
jgi:hypothetical protein